MATVFGALFFDDWPDVTALAGAAVIIGAGLFLWWRGRVADRAARVG
jgi:drug/metabolite transporter (DMT)-like permease